MIEIMELCTARGLSQIPLLPPSYHFPHCHTHSFNPQIRVPFVSNHARLFSGLRYNRNLSMRLATSEGPSTETTPYGRDETETEPDGFVTAEARKPDDKKEETYTQLNEMPQEDSLDDNPRQLFKKFLEDFDIKFENDETYSLLVFGGGGAVALWLAAAVVGAIDSIPLFPKVLELIGLGYTVWFSSRYLIFKESRDELVAKVEHIKQEVLGSKDD